MLVITFVERAEIMQTVKDPEAAKKQLAKEFGIGE